MAELPTEQENQPRSFQPDFVPTIDRGSPKKRVVSIAAVVVGLVLLIFAGSSILGRGGKKEEKATPAPLPQVTAPSLPEITPSPTPQAATLSIQILNGSGIAGEAGRAATLLKAVGFQLIETGNASGFDFKETEVAVKASVSDELVAKIEKALAKTYILAKTTRLSSDKAADVIITVGKSKVGATPTPSATSSGTNQ